MERNATSTPCLILVACLKQYPVPLFVSKRDLIVLFMPKSKLAPTFGNGISLPGPGAQEPVVYR
jgi:hypothetical protein